MKNKYYKKILTKSNKLYKTEMTTKQHYKKQTTTNKKKIENKNNQINEHNEKQ